MAAIVTMYSPSLAVISLRDQVTGLAVCNEPSRLIPADVLASFYDQVRAVVARGESGPVGVC